jgi:hypothetical protein
VYSVFIHPNVELTRAIETPKSPQVRFHDMITVALGDHGVITHVIDDTGEATAIHPRVTPKVTNFP